MNVEYRFSTLPTTTLSSSDCSGRVSNVLVHTKPQRTAALLGILEKEIAKRLQECTNPSFLEYLSNALSSSQDSEEQEGLSDLILQIEQMKMKLETTAVTDQHAAAADKAQKEAEEEDAVTTAAPTKDNSKAMSNADILRKANQIDAAIALSDEEKPSDFMSDCREVVNLSRGYNDLGQMRVGGR